MRIVSPHRVIEHPPMPYCVTHDRLYPSPYVGWLTPAGVEGLVLVPWHCDVCYAAMLLTSAPVSAASGQ